MRYLRIKKAFSGFCKYYICHFLHTIHPVHYVALSNERNNLKDTRLTFQLSKDFFTLYFTFASYFWFQLGHSILFSWTTQHRRNLSANTCYHYTHDSMSSGCPLLSQEDNNLKVPIVWNLKQENWPQRQRVAEVLHTTVARPFQRSTPWVRSESSFSPGGKFFEYLEVSKSSKKTEIWLELQFPNSKPFLIYTLHLSTRPLDPMEGSAKLHALVWPITNRRKS